MSLVRRNGILGIYDPEVGFLPLMAGGVDNVTLDAGSGGATIKTDDDGTAHWQYIKAAFGADNTQTRVTSTVGLPTDPLDRAARDLGKVDIAQADPLTATGTITAVSTGVTLDVQGYGVAAIQITGTWVATIGFDVNVDGTNWVDIAGVPPSGGTAVTTTTANGMWLFNVGGSNQIRAFSDAFTSGTVQVDIQANIASGAVSNEVEVITFPDNEPFNVAQVAGTATSVNGGAEDAGTIRVTVANNSTGVLSVDDNAASLTIDNATLDTVGGGTEAAAQRVTIANNSTGLLSVDDNGASLTVDGTITANAGTGDFLTVIGHTINEVFKESAAIGGQLDDTATTAATENNVAPVRITAQRSLHTTIRASDGSDISNATNGVLVNLGANNDVTIQANAAVNVAQMNGVATTMGNGISGTGVQRVTIASDSTGKVEVVGDVARDAAVAGNPVLAGARSSEVEPTATSADGDAVDLWADRKGSLIVTENAASRVISDTAGTNAHGPKTVTLTLTADAALVAAPGASLSTYVTSVSASNTSATKSRVDIKDGTNIRISHMLAADGGGFVMQFNPPWKVTANTALNGALGTAVTDVRVNVHYFTAA